jgi:hypothetical protein
MERTMWTDERLDDLTAKMDVGFARVDADIREVRSDLRDLRSLIFGLWGTNTIAILATIAVVLART